MNRFTEDKVDKFNKKARALIDVLSDTFNEEVVDELSISWILEYAAEEYQKYKRKCFFVKVLVLAICGVIVYFHIWG